MNRAMELIGYMENNGGRVMFGGIMKKYRGTTLGYKVTQAVSEARQILMPTGKTIECTKNHFTPSKNLYSFSKIQTIRHPWLGW